jgi:hypothetical protein
LRIVVVLVWVVLALIMVVPVVAQGDGGTNQAANAQTSSTPQDLNGVAARLAPLLVGAALIERTIEFLFNWVERALLDTSSYLHGIAVRLSGLVQVDLRQAWNSFNQLNRIFQARQGSTAPDAASAGKPESSNPAEWPLATLEARLADAQTGLVAAQTKLTAAMKSPEYIARKKVVASVISIGMGIALALAASLHLFEALDVQVADWFKDPFNVIDMILAGILMGLGTDWVHQTINVLTKGQRFLGSAADERSVDVDQIKEMVSAATQTELEAQLKRLREEAVSQVEAASSKLTDTQNPPG